MVERLVAFRGGEADRLLWLSNAWAKQETKCGYRRFGKVWIEMGRFRFLSFLVCRQPWPIVSWRRVIPELWRRPSLIFIPVVLQFQITQAINDVWPWNIFQTFPNQFDFSNFNFENLIWVTFLPQVLYSCPQNCPLIVETCSYPTAIKEIAEGEGSRCISSLRLGGNLYDSKNCDMRLCTFFDAIWLIVVDQGLINALFRKKRIEMLGTDRSW